MAGERNKMEWFIRIKAMLVRTQAHKMTLLFFHSFLGKLPQIM